MHARLPLAAVAVIALLLATGCVAVPAGVGDDQSSLAPESPGSDDWTTTVDESDGPIGRSDPVSIEGELPVNATRTFRRVERLTGVDAPAPRVEVERLERDRGRQLPPSNSLRALGFTNATGDYRECATIGSGSAGGETVTISPVDPTTGDRLSEESIELILAHEFAHVVDQHRSDQRATTDRGAEEADEAPIDPTVNFALREGFAVAVSESYAREYGTRWEGQRPMELRWCLYQESRNTLGRASAAYYFGGRYYLQTLDGTGEFREGIASPPATTEQLLHPETRGDEPPTPLSVTAMESRSWRTKEQYSLLGDPAGEASIRVWLGSALDRDRVDAAATGWGNGTTLTYVNGDGTERTHGAVMVLRWDSEADATEFETAASEASGPIEDRGDTELRVDRVSPDTVIVAGGPASFADGLEASATDGSVTLTPPGEP